MTAECFYCEDGEKRRSLMIEICRLRYATVYLFRDQKHRGRVVVKFNEHKTEICQLTPEENAGFFAELSQVAQALITIFKPDKLNYAIYGDGVPHLHVHVVPKYRGGLQWGGPFTDDIAPVHLSEEEYTAMVRELKAAIAP